MEEEEEKPGLAEALLGPEPKEGGLGRKVQAVEGLKGTELGEKGQGPVEGLLLQGEEELALARKLLGDGTLALPE